MGYSQPLGPVLVSKSGRKRSALTGPPPKVGPVSGATAVSTHTTLITKGSGGQRTTPTMVIVVVIVLYAISLWVMQLAVRRRVIVLSSYSLSVFWWGYSRQSEGFSR
jgi:hypothetical protein